MICAICQGNSSPDTESERYCPACDGYGSHCDKCGEPALLMDAANYQHRCLDCSMKELDHRYLRILLILLSLGTGFVGAILVWHAHSRS